MTTKPVKKADLTNVIPLKFKSEDNGGITDEQIKKINSMKFNGPKKKLSKDDIFVRSMIVMGEEPTTRMSIHPEGILNGKTVKILSQLAADLPGAPMLIGHNFDTAPWGRIFEAKVLKGGEGYSGNIVKIWYYFLNNNEGKDISDKIDSGIYSEGSISYTLSKPLCSICHGRIGFSWYEEKGKRCTEHQIGEKYNVDGVEQVCYFYPSKITKVLEVSFVFRGAYEKTQANYIENFSEDIKLGINALEQLVSEQSIHDDDFDLDNLEENSQENSEDTEDTEDNSNLEGNNDENSENSENPENSESTENNNETIDDSGSESNNPGTILSECEGQSNVDGNDSESLENIQPPIASQVNSVSQLSLPGKLVINSDGSKVFRADDILVSGPTIDNNSNSVDNANVDTNSLEPSNTEVDELEFSENSEGLGDSECSEDSDCSEEELEQNNAETETETETETDINNFKLFKIVVNNKPLSVISFSSDTFVLFGDVSKDSTERIQTAELFSEDYMSDKKLEDSGSYKLVRDEKCFKEYLLFGDKIKGRYYISKSVVSLSSSYQKLLETFKLKSSMAQLFYRAKNQENDSVSIYGVDNIPVINYNSSNGYVFFDVID